MHQSPGDRRLEFEQKRSRVEAWLGEVKMDGLLLRRKENFAWITCGGDHGVDRFSEVGATAAWVDAGGIVLLAPGDEVARIDEEELEGLPVEIVAWPWYKDSEREVQRFLAGRRAVSDTAYAGLADLSDSVRHLRYSLTPQETARYRALGKELATAVESVCGELRRGASERALSARLVDRLRSAGIEPEVVFVAADDRIDRYTHPIPTEARVEHRAMFRVAARRSGLVAALTRIAQFGDLSMEMESRHQAVVEVDAGIIAASRPGARGSELFERLCDLYSEAGYPGEWELRRQGGAIGYANRDWIAHPGQTETVRPYQAVAWCPAITGTKSEDTVLVTETGFEVLTKGDGGWPVRVVDAGGAPVERPDILRL